MSDSKRSPGPWLFDGDSAIVDAHGRDLAYVGDYDFEKQVANGRLLAAAPDLLAALDEIVANALSLPRSHVAGCVNVDRNDMDRAIAVLARAKGIDLTRVKGGRDA